MEADIVITEPGLSATEASALVAILGPPGKRHTLRSFDATPDWLDRRCFGRSLVAIDELVCRIDGVLAQTPRAITALTFTGLQHTIIDAAFFHTLDITTSDDTYLSRYGINRKRALHLREAMRSEHSIASALRSVTDPEVKAQVSAMRDAAREMRRWRHAIYNGRRAIILSPELNLMADALNVASGLSARGFLQGSIESAWNKFEDDTQPHREPGPARIASR